MPRPPHISSADLAEAVIRLVVERGLDAVSLRAAAGEAGVSVGAVQHYFASKDELLLAAYGRVIDRVVARAPELPDAEADPRSYLEALLEELLPLDARREAEVRVAIAFSARSVHNPRLADLYREGYRALVDAVERAFAAASARGEAPGDLDPRREAKGAIALADGLAWESLCAPRELSPAAAASLLRAHLASRLVT